MWDIQYCYRNTDVVIEYDVYSCWVMYHSDLYGWCAGAICEYEGTAMFINEKSISVVSKCRPGVWAVLLLLFSWFLVMSDIGCVEYVGVMLLLCWLCSYMMRWICTVDGGFVDDDAKYIQYIHGVSSG